MTSIDRPKLLFIRYRHSGSLAPIFELHRELHIKCLSQYFDVVALEDDIDYPRACENFGADMAMFEMRSGLEHNHSKKPVVRHAGSYDAIPKVAFFNADSWCEDRSGFYDDMDTYGIETAFSICMTAPERSPELDGQLYVWPNFIDPAIFRNFGQLKTIPVLLTGASFELYPWRQSVFKVLTKAFPSLTLPHAGYMTSAEAGSWVIGEQYARAINGSMFTPTCGTLTRELVRKHLEIPAAMSCLITERTPSLEAAGFADMTNCIFADRDDVVDKVQYLFDNPDVLEAITIAGYDLVHSRHTLAQRDQVFNWYELNKRLQPGQFIAQPNPFGPLDMADKASSPFPRPLMCGGLDLQLLAVGDESLTSERYKDAERVFMEVHRLVPAMPEAKVRLALARLHAGNPRPAALVLANLARRDLEAYGASAPDPEVWGLFVASMLCLGRLDSAIAGARCFPELRGYWLDRVRIVVSELALPSNQLLLASTSQTHSRRSVHQFPPETPNQWLEHFVGMLRACDQTGYASRVLERLNADGLRTALETEPEAQVQFGPPRSEALELIAAIARDQRRSLERRPSFVAKRIAKAVMSERRRRDVADFLLRWSERIAPPARH